MPRFVSINYPDGFCLFLGLQAKSLFISFAVVSPRGVGVKHWPCNPRVSGSIPGGGNLKKLFIWMKIHGVNSHKNHKAFVQMAKQLEQRSGKISSTPK